MITVEDECVGCTSMGMPCLGDRCRNRNVKRYFCDKCGHEFAPEELYDYDGEHRCADCILGDFKTLAQLEEDDY